MVNLFKMLDHIYIKKNGCRKCSSEINAKKITSNTIKFIEKANLVHNGFYGYEEVDYIDVFTEIIIKCEKHGYFKQKPNVHLKGSGCQSCGIEGTCKVIFKKDSILFIEQCIKKHNGLYKYDKTIYNGSNEKILIKCEKHGYFYQCANYHLSGGGCPSCKSSKGESNIQKYLTDMCYNFETQKSFIGCEHINSLLFDFYLFDYNLCIEYDGKQHFEPIKYFGGIEEFEKNKIRDEIKNQYCLDNNINLLRIPYYEMKNTEKILYEYFKKFGEDNCSNI